MRHAHNFGDPLCGSESLCYLCYLDNPKVPCPLCMEVPSYWIGGPGQYVLVEFTGGIFNLPLSKQRVDISPSITSVKDFLDKMKYRVGNRRKRPGLVANGKHIKATTATLGSFGFESGSVIRLLTE